MKIEVSALGNMTVHELARLTEQYDKTRDHKTAQELLDELHNERVDYSQLNGEIQK